MEEFPDPCPVRELEAGVQAAEAMLAAGRHREALQAYSALLDRLLARRLGIGRDFRAADLVVLERVAELAALMSRVAAADDVLQAMVRLCSEAGNELAADHAQLKRAEMQAGTGRLRAAYERLGELSSSIGTMERIDLDAAGLQAWEARIAWRRHPAEDRAVLLTRCYAVMGRILVGLGHHGQALAAIDRGLFHAEARGAPDLARRAHWPLLLLRARALMERGDLEVAQAAANELSRGHAAHQPIGARVQLHELQGKLALLRGRLGDATHHLSEALAGCASGDFPRAHAVAALNLAHALVLLNRVGEALGLVADSTRLAHELRDEPLRLRCAAVRQVAIARRSSGAEAMTVALSVREMVEGPGAAQGDTLARPEAAAPTVEGENHLALFEDRALEFQWMLGTSTAAAARLLEGLRLTFGHTDSRIVHARLPMLEGLLHAQRGDHARAADCFEQASLACASMGLLPDQWQSMQLQSRSLQRLDRPEAAGPLAERADELLAALAGSLDGGERALFLLNKSTVQEEKIAAQVQSLLQDTARIRTSAPIAGLALRVRLLRRLHAMLHQLDRHKAGLADRQVDASPGSRAGAAPRSWSLPARLLHPPRNRATLEFVVLPDQLLIVWSSFLRMGYSVSPVTRLELRELVRRWHEQAQSALDAADLPPHEALAQANAGNQLLATLARRLQLDAVLDALPAQVDHLTILADDVLHGLPFAALPRSGGYLIERYSLSMAFDSRLRPEAGRRVTRGLLVGVGQRAGAQRLGAVDRECVEAEAWFQRHGIASESLREAAATCEAVSARLGEAEIVHLACHGSFEPDQPDRSGLLLAASPDSDGQLSIRRLAAIPLRRCRLVTMTSCWSADSFVLPGRWIVSLPEVLWRSGVQSVLGALWPVVDEVAAPFMQRFHAALERLPLDAALREAQLACLAEPGSPRALIGEPVDAPYFWAGYQLYGDPGQLLLRGPDRTRERPLHGRPRWAMRAQSAERLESRIEGHLPESR